MILFVFAYHKDSEFERYQFILDNWEKFLDMKTPFQFLFVKSIDRDLQTHFKHQFIERKDPPDLKKFQCIGQEWAMVAEYIESHIDCKCWFWWEHDVLPVKKDCFDFFMRKWTPSCLIMGYRVRDNKWGMRKKLMAWLSMAGITGVSSNLTSTSSEPRTPARHSAGKRGAYMLKSINGMH